MGEPGGRGPRPRQAGPPRRRRAQARAAAADPRRRGVRRPGRRRRDAQPSRALQGYTTGGTIHVVVNNQIGFTTAPDDARSTRYCTDITRMLRCPVFHVNGEDPEAVAQVVQLAAEYRQRYGQDVVIDLYCYRQLRPQRGRRAALHAAGDVRGHRQASRACARCTCDVCIERGQITRRRGARRSPSERREQHRGRAARSAPRHTYVPLGRARWAACGRATGAAPTPSARRSSTAVPREQLSELARQAHRHARRASTRNRKIKRMLKERAGARRAARRRSTGAPPRRSPTRRCSHEGTRVRLSGQDARRGTFIAPPRGALRRARPASRTCRSMHLGDELGQLRGLRQPAVARRACSASSTATASTRPTRW